MPTDTLVGDLADLVTLADPAATGPYAYEPLDHRHREQVAELYRLSYPPHIGAADRAEALAEMDATFAGDYGRLLPAASLVAVDGARAVGSVQVVHRSPWDPDLHCPFVIELFVHPDARGHGLGRSLLARAAAACLRRGETQLALRTDDEGTSAAARHLYRVAGMRSWAAPG